MVIELYLILLENKLGLDRNNVSQWGRQPGARLLTWFNINPSTDK